MCEHFVKQSAEVKRFPSTGIDTDKHKYPLGSARVTFNNCHSYFKAVAAAFIDVRSSKFKRKVFQIDPYLEDSLCSGCGVQHGPYFCRELSCFRYDLHIRHYTFDGSHSHLFFRCTDTFVARAGSGNIPVTQICGRTNR